MSSICIFCKERVLSRAPEEHIIPVGLGVDGPTLHQNEVCGRCNRTLKRADENLQQALGFWVARFSGVTRSGTASFSGRNFQVRTEEEGVVVRVFSTKDDIARARQDPRVRFQPSKKHALKNVSFDRDGPIGRFRWNMDMKADSGVSRGLHKIAFEHMCFRYGVDHVLDPVFDNLREEILGKRNFRRRFLMLVRRHVPDNTTYPPGVTDSEIPPCEYPLVAISLYAFVYIVSMSPRDDSDLAAYMDYWKDVLVGGFDNDWPEFQLALFNTQGRVERVVSSKR